MDSAQVNEIGRDAAGKPNCETFPGGDMTLEFEFIDKHDYLVATLPDTTINSQRAQAIFKSIHGLCQQYNCRKVLLNELALESRKIPSHELRAITEIIADLHLAFLCRPELIDNHARLLSAMTFADDYRVKHFSVKDEAVDWLVRQH